MSTTTNRLLRDARVYLSGPMDFVASRAQEMETGWRNRVGQFLREMGVTVFDPWNKPDVLGLHEYGRETPETSRTRQDWTFEKGDEGAAKRASCAAKFWPALHMDLRMVDTSDFVIAYCPTNIYSVGTPHEIITARNQRKPVLFVSPRVTFDSLAALREHLEKQNDRTGLEHLKVLEDEVPIKENRNGAPSLWYMPLIAGEYFFDGFGFEQYREHFKWAQITPLEERERRDPPTKPLLAFLSRVNEELPERWNRHLQRLEQDDDWLLWDIRREAPGGATVDSARAHKR